MQFNLTQPRIVGSIDELNPQAETGFLKSSPSFVLKNENGMARQVLEKLRGILSEDDFASLAIDTRKHLLFEDHYPCIPGWHCDFVSRNAEGVIEPNPELDREVRHFLCVVGEPCPELLHIDNLELDISTPHWRQVSQMIEEKGFVGVAINSAEITEIDATTLHRGMPAKKTGWRWFFRATLFPVGDKRRGDVVNELREQSQVYLVSEHTGW